MPRQPDLKSLDYRVPSTSPHSPRNGSRGKGVHRVVRGLAWRGPWLLSAHLQVLFCQGVGPRPLRAVGWWGGEGARGLPLVHTSCPCTSSHNHHKGGTVDCGAEVPWGRRLRAHALSTSMTGHCCYCVIIIVNILHRCTLQNAAWQTESWPGSEVLAPICRGQPE